MGLRVDMYHCIGFLEFRDVASRTAQMGKTTDYNMEAGITQRLTGSRLRSWV